MIFFSFDLAISPTGLLSIEDSDQPWWSGPGRASGYLTKNHQTVFRGKGWESGCVSESQKCSLSCAQFPPFHVPKGIQTFTWEGKDFDKKEGGCDDALSHDLLQSTVWLWLTEKRPVIGLGGFLPLLGCGQRQWGHKSPVPLGHFPTPDQLPNR